ncbi:MAG: hypothetical protein Q9170_003016 [Blastenia crenularia]
MDNPTLNERAASILKFTNFLSDQLANLKLLEPSFEHGLPSALHKDAPDSLASAARQSLLQELDEFRALLTEPTLLLTPELRNPNLSVHSIVRLGVAENFPSQGGSVQDLAQKLGLGESLLRRLLAHAATHHIYRQASPGFYVHTAASRVLAEDEGMRKWILIGSEELIPATLKVFLFLTLAQHFPRENERETEKCQRQNLPSVDSRRLSQIFKLRRTRTQRTNHPLLVSYRSPSLTLVQGWNLQNTTGLPIFRALANMPSRASVFAGAMAYHAQLPGFSASYLVSAFPWSSFNPSELITIVDVGGGLGHVSESLIAHGPNVRCIVQDSPGTVAQAQEKELPPEVQGRISFQGHDFFEPQPVKDADVYLLRLVLHDWSDKYAVMIVRALIPALKPGARVVVNDRVLPALGEAHYLVEREGRDYDMYMLAFQNAKERTAEDWKMLFRTADERFGVSEVVQPARSALAVVVATWGG